MKICLFGNKKATEILLIHLVKENSIKIDSLITLSQASARKVEISGKSDSLLSVASENMVKVHQVNSYALKGENDATYFKRQAFDLGLCTGWQRLIPDEILSTFKFGVFGWHGSGFELPGGRGRSPLNWSIRLGLNHVYHNCFRYDAGVDSGHIYHTHRFDIDDDDYISDLQTKALDHIKDSSLKLIRDCENKCLTLMKQPDYPEILLPKLSPSTGCLSQSVMSSETALRIIRSCSRPFPGAFYDSKTTRYRIWSAWRKAEFRSDSKICSLEDVSVDNGTLIIKLVDGFILSNDFQIEQLVC